MANEQGGIEQEMLEECAFWGVYTGEVRRPANSALVRFYWLARLFLRGVVLCLRFPLHLTRRDAARDARCDVLAVYVTENQRRAFAPWLGQNPRMQTASWMRSADWDISWSRCGALTLCYLWPVYRALRRRADREQTIPWLEEFVRYRVGSVLANDLYCRARPRVVAVSNDHSGMFRAFIRQARRHGCKVIYSQHASIGRHFPILNFDLAMLDGAQAYLHYLESGRPSGNIVITGRNRPTPVTRAVRADQPLRIGLATNWDDSLLEWIAILRRVRSEFEDVVLRCHPAETRKWAWRLLCRLTGVRLESGRLEDFLRPTSVLISGMSGIILDAALHGVPCLLKLSSLRRSDLMTDYFGYQQFGLCKPIPNLNALPQLIVENGRRTTDADRVGVYEAGLVQDPAEEKRATLDLFMEALHEGGSVQTQLSRRYTHVLHEGVHVFMSAQYAELNARHGWISSRNHPQ